MDLKKKKKFHVPGYLHESEKTKSLDILKKKGWHGVKKNSVLFRFLPTLKNNLIDRIIAVYIIDKVEA